MTLKLSLMRWLVTLVGVQFLCAIAWVLGPLVPALEPWPVRAVLVMAVLLAWAAANLALDIRRAQMDQALTQGLTGAAQDEAAAVQERLATALSLLRQNKGKGKRGYLYEQPWYAIIGPPGAGKTTALLNAGLEFPLAGALGPGAVSGVGGTRLCEWWFTDDAVLIDTAGRYTTQDSNQSVDRAGWQAFLALLRRARPRQPLNGVLVAIALDDVVAETTAAQAAHAAAIRSRIDELEATLGLRLPVYALLTKSDLLVGFTEFFDDLDRAGREQIWGATFPLEGTPDFAASLRTLLGRLDRRVFARLDPETNGDRRALIAGFPAQFASVLGPVQAFLTAAFGPGAGGTTAPMLRGVYFTSGTQEGTPIDRLTGALSRAFGLDQKRAARLRPEAGRAYFLAGLLKTVVFREALLVSHRPGAARRRMVLRMAGFAACALLAVAGTTVMLVARASGLSAVDRAQAALASQVEQAKALALDPVSDADTLALLPWLNTLHDAAAAPPGAPDALGFAQDTKLAAGAEAAYRHALDHALFPRLVWRAETQMRGMLGQGDALYDATRIYLMLGGAGPLDRDLLREWFVRDWAQTLPGDAEAGNRAALGRHLTALLGGALPPIALDGPLVAQARTTIGRVPLAQRAWSRLKPTASARDLLPWRPSDVLGPAGVRVFLRLSGRGLEDGIPGLYTVKGLREAVLPALPRAAQEAASESWVLGEPIDPQGPQRRTLEGDITALYAAEYAAAWDGMLKDLDLAPMRSLTQAAQDLYILASSNSPLRKLLVAAALELSPASTLPVGSAARDHLAALDERYRPLRLLFGTGGAAPIDQALRPLGDLQQQLAKQAASTTKPAPPSAADDPAVALRTEAARQPQPLARWMVAMATGGAALRDGGPRGAMIAAWNAGGGPAALCPAIIADRFPFVAAATADASIEDFSRLLGPGGAIDAFFNAQLKPYVDTAARPWRLQQVDGVAAPLTAADLLQFQRAAAIRDLFFQGGSAQPLVRFDLAAGPLDPQATAVRLEVGSATVGAAREAPGRPAALTWPGRPPAMAARLTITAAPPAQIETSGPWALFRLLAKARATPGADRTTLLFAVGDRQARFDLRATPNPFASPLLTEFKCPAVQ